MLICCNSTVTHVRFYGINSEMIIFSSYHSGYRVTHRTGVYCVEK